ncbi:MAG: ATP-binding protein [Acidobacteriota bacterium]|jgi:signal transduction histidine kinase
MLRSLYAKLSLALLAVLAIIGVLYLLVTLVTTRVFLQEVNQKLDRDVAEHLVAEVPLFVGGQVDEAALEQIFHMMMVANPSIEIYLLDPGGAILAYSAPPGKVQADRVALEPIRRFLEGRVTLPITGDDPRHPGRRKAFSAATIEHDGDLEGYLYVVLGGEHYDTAVQMLQGSYALRLGVAALLAALLFALLAGLLLFSVLTRRLRRLADAMEGFARSGFSEGAIEDVPRPSGGGDEIDRLGVTFREMAERMAENLQELRRADSLRREVVANVSHDLRTPLASLRGYLETVLLKEGELSPGEQRRYVETALQHSDSLERLVSELFELARLESWETLPHPEPFAVGELVQDVSQKFRLEAERRQVRLQADLVKDLPFVAADIGMIERVLENLLDNALRYTPAGGEVRLSTGRCERGVAVEVADTGSGIPEEDLPHIFDRFYRRRDAVEAGHGGAGLGLAISKKILDLHGSRIEVRSAAGTGTTFRFQLPLQPPPPPRRSM